MAELEKADPKFVSVLARKLTAELRRQDRLYPVSSQFRRFRNLMIVLMAALGGFAVATAAQRYQVSEERQLQLERARAVVGLKEARLDLAKEYLGELANQPEPDRETLAVSGFELNQVSRELRRARLDFEEIQLTGLAPQNELVAPRISGRDFVSERLDLSRQTVQERLTLIQTELDRLSEGSSDSPNGLQQQAFEVERASIRSDEAKIAHQLKLRDEFLSGRISAGDVVLQSEWVGARERLEITSSRRRAVEAQMAWFEERFQTGQVSALDLKYAQFELVQARTEERLAELEYEHLKKRLGW